MERNNYRAPLEAAIDQYISDGLESRGWTIKRDASVTQLVGFGPVITRNVDTHMDIGRLISKLISVGLALATAGVFWFRFVLPSKVRLYTRIRQGLFRSESGIEP